MKAIPNSHCVKIKTTLERKDFAVKWSEVRERYPDKIVLVEALSTTSFNKRRTVKDMSILADFNDDMAAWQEYKKQHKDNLGKELYIFHTSKEKAEVVEQFFAGVRGSL